MVRPTALISRAGGGRFIVAALSGNGRQVRSVARRGYCLRRALAARNTAAGEAVVSVGCDGQLAGDGVFVGGGVQLRADGVGFGTQAGVDDGVGGGVHPSR